MSTQIEAVGVPMQVGRASEKAKLVKSLNGFHSVFFILAGMISIEILGQVASYGPATLTWVVILAVIFLVPYGLIIAELGAAYPLEGGPYVWIKRAWGKTVAGLAAVLYSIGNPLWIGGVLTFAAASAFDSYIHPLPQGSVGDWTFKLAFIWIAIVSAIVSLRKGKWIPTTGAIARILALVLFCVALAVYAIRHGVHGFAASGLAPTSFVVFLGLTPILLFAYAGFEMPSTAAEEMVDAVRDVPRAISRATVITILIYSVPIFGILVVLPTKDITGIGGFLDAAAKAFSVFGAAAGAMVKIEAAAFIFGLLTAGSSWMMAGDRAWAIAAQDGAGPRYFGVFSARFGTPVRVNVLTGVLATTLLVVAQFLNTGSAAASFTVLLYLATSTGIMCYIFIFSAALRLRLVDADTPRPFRIPLGTAGMAICSIVTTALVLLGTWVAVFPGTIEEATGHTFDMQATFGVSRLQFEVFTLGTLFVILLIAVVSVLIGRHESRTPPTVAIPAAHPTSTMKADI